MVIAASAVFSSYAAGDGIIETRNYTICPGDTIRIDTRQTKVYRDTVLYDTLQVTDPGADSIIRYVVNVMPSYVKSEERLLEAGTSFTWCDQEITAGGDYERIYKTQDGCDSIYRLHVTVEETRSFTLCDDETVSFNGQVYSNAGTYYNTYSRDTTYKVIITKHPSQLHQQTGYLDAMGNPYYWQYQVDGETKTDTLTTAGVYEYMTQNPETGCNDIWRLILRKSDTGYRFDSVATVCENEYFEWRGMKNLNRQGIGQTTDYYDSYLTASTLQDSVYHLALTVIPVPRTTQTIPFCGEITWKGETIKETKTLIDTLVSLKYGCDSIITTQLVKGISITQKDTAYITPGETIRWRGRTIDQDGHYEDRVINESGCENIYSIEVLLKPAPIATNVLTERATSCEGEGYTWRGRTFYNSGEYIDTIKTTTGEIDSLYILHLKVYPKYTSTERVTYPTFPQTYRGRDIPAPGEYTFTYQTVFGCDSVITVYVDSALYRTEETVVICPNETYIWQWSQQAYSESGTYVVTEKDVNGQDSAEHVLHLSIRYIPETYVEATICQGQTYTFGEQTLTQSGVYTYSYHKTGGCDSTVVLSLNVLRLDTTRLAIQRRQGDSYVWGTETITKPGTYFHYGTNRFGCDSVAILEFTYNQVDTIEEHVTVCPNELPYVWNGIQGNQTQHYSTTVQQPAGNYIYYSLYLTVREVQQVDTTFTICDDGSISFNGKTYSEAGHFRDWLSCDTLMNITIIKHAQQVYETRASITDDRGYTWTYWENGAEQTETFNAAGTYEFESPNATTGCSEIWRLILTKDETSYHFVETITICEGDDYSWRGKTNLSGVPGTSHYFDQYETHAGKDSIYELVLTVTPVKRTIQTITFCGETTWKGQVLTNSTVVYDTITSSTGCDSIVRVNFDKVTPFYSHDTATIVQGETLLWHGQAISSDGLYMDQHTNIYGCDSTYTLGVGVIAATPQTNMFTTQYSICDGDVYTWRGHDYSPTTTTTYVDTVYKAGTNNIDSIFVLKLTVHTSYPDTIVRHLYTCGEIGASIRYQGKEYYEDDTIISNLRTVYGCDSIVKAYLHFNTALFLSDTVRIADTELPYTWHFRLSGSVRDSVITAAGTYNHYEAAEGTCVNHEQLVLFVYPTYLYEQDTTICETDLPFYWLRGPSDHITDALQHTVGQTKQYEYRYQTVNNTDSIYRLHLTIDPAPKATERYYVCEGEPQKIHGMMYGEGGMTRDSLYRDTVYTHSDGTICDSIIYVEVFVASRKQHIETVILHDDESIDWNGYHITSKGEYSFTTHNVGPAGCDSISILRVIREFGDERILCSNDTAEDVHPDKKYPLVWEHPNLQHAPDTLYTTGTYRDTIYDDLGYITDIYRMDLTVVHPYDTTVVVHGCKDKGALWRDRLYYSDTVFVDRVEVVPHTQAQPCDSVFHVTIKMDTVYNISIVDTICEYELPYILGTQDPDTIWGPTPYHMDNQYTHHATTACGCDSIVTLTLTIIPSLNKNDSTFVCEEWLNAGNYVWLGDTIDPWFEHRENGKFSGQWQGKWFGVPFSEDTIVYNCDSSFHHHIIVRPHQSAIPEKTYSLCKGDSVQLFWPNNDMWIKTPGVYYDTVPTISPWLDTKHSTTIHNDRAYACDSITKWTVVYADTLRKDTFVHIRQGETYRWNDSILSTTGVYDSIGYAPDMDSAHHYCTAVYTMHLTVDPVYRYKDTIEICQLANREYTHTFNDDLTDHFAFSFLTPNKDTAILHLSDSLKHLSYQFYDHFYDLVVYYKQQYFTQIKDTICYGDSLQFDQHHLVSESNMTTERYLKKAGVYVDTLRALNGCDSIIELRLTVRNRIDTVYSYASVVDRELPYEWKHTWPGGSKIDSLYESGTFYDTLQSIHGCDSIVGLRLTVRPTYLYRDTIDTCAAANTTLTHVWPDGYKQFYTTPSNKDTANLTYKDTMIVSNPPDSVFYELYVRYYRTYETHVYDTICAGDSAHIDSYLSSLPKTFYKETGIYRDTTTTIYGCDSIITLHLQVWPSFPTRYKYVDINETDTPYLWIHTYVESGVLQRDTDSISIPGNYGRHLYNIHGCDSIDSLTLRIHPNYRFEDTVTVCGYEVPYVWTGPDGSIYKNDIYDSGTYTRQWRTADGFGDSTRVLKFRVLPLLYTLRLDTMCYGDSIQFGKENGQPRYFHEQGIYFDTLTSFVHGCDSVIEMRLNVYDKHLNKYTHHIMRDELPYKWYHVTANTTDTIDTTTIIAEGQFGYTFRTPFGCDSIDSLTLVVHDDYLYRDSVTICADQTPYTWYSPDSSTIYRDGITESNEYVYTLRRADGYSDSTLIRKVTVLPIFHTIRYDTLCYGDSILFGLSKQAQPRYLSVPGVYYDTLSSIQHGCDSIIEMRLNVFPHFHRYHSVVGITDADLPYKWYHYPVGGTVAIDSTEIHGDGDFEYLFKTSHGCDSIDHLTVRVHPNYRFHDIVTICSDATPYTWYGPDSTVYKSDIYDSGLYTHHMRTADGIADSIYTREVTVVPVKHTFIYDSICESNTDFYVFKGQQLKIGGVYHDTLTSKENGCDSIVTLYLTVNKPYYNYIERHIVEGYSTTIFGQTYDKDTTFSLIGTTPSGCDSVTNVKVIMHPMVDTIVHVCSTALPYLWTNKWTGQVTPLYTTGIYRNDTTYDANGTRLFYGLQLIVDEPTYSSITASICEGDSLRFGLSKANRPRFLYDAGSYTDTLVNANGCDSVVTLTLNVYPKYSNHAIVDIADTALPYEWKHIQGGNVVATENLYADGEYVYHFTSIFGCDSVDSLSLRVHRTYRIEEPEINLCSDQTPYTWHTHTNITATGDYTFYGQTADGYDSIRTVHINVWDVQYTTIDTTVCEGGAVRFKGQLRSEQGTYIDTLTTVHGCDSIVTLHLTVVPINHTIVSRTIYQGDSVLFLGQYYSIAGSYPVRLTSVATGCDSIVELQLSVNKLFDDSVTVCYNELPLEWRGQTIYESGIYRDTVVSSQGQRTVSGIKVIVLPVVRNETPILDTICQGDTYLFGSKKRALTESGTYYDTLTSVRYGCDSIVSLILYVQPLKYQTEQKTIFDGDSILFFGKWHKETGIYNYSEPVANGKCFNTYQLILTVIKPVVLDTTAIVCENELPFIWHGHEYNTAGKHTLPIAWTDTSRITMVLDLQINPVLREERVVDICDGSTYIYKGKEFRTNETFYDTIPSQVGCDSILKYIIRVHPTYDRIDTVHISDKQPYEWHDRKLNLTGEYEWTGHTTHGCDSMEHLILIVHPSFFRSDTVDLCQSDSIHYPYRWRDENGRLIQTITESGVYSDSVLTEYGFDSVHQVVVYIRPSYFTKEQYEIGDGEILKIHGRDISKPAVYYDTLRTIYGCDSVFHVVVNAKRTREFTWNKTICQGEYFDFFGEKKTNTGRYTYTSQYKDSIVYLNLTVNPVSYSEKRIIITDKQTSYIYDGQLYTNLQLGENLFTKTMVNQYGCDSIHRLIICVTQRYSNWDPIPLCPGGEVKIDGKVITEAGLYTFERRSRVTGEMDSLYRVEVYDAPAFDLPLEKATICQGDTFFYGGKNLTRAGHYDFSLKTVSGCDSLLHLDLTVNPSYQFYTDATIADYETYSWRGKEYTKTGNYDVSFPTVLDCDSTYTLRLTVVETKRQLTDDTICVGNTYNWRGREITEEGIYTDTVRHLETGFSAIYTLKLTILYPTFITSATVGEVCADGEEFDIAFTYSGARPTAYSIYFDQLAKNEGFKDVINQPFLGDDGIARAPVPSKKEVIYLEHTAYIKPNRYSMRLVLDNGVCGISRSDSLLLLVRYPSWIIEQNWNDVVAPLRKEYNGGYEFAQSDWYVNGVLQPNNSLGYLHSDKLKEGDEVIMVATRKGESFSIPTCPLTIHANTGNVYTDPILVYPTQAPHLAPHITIEAPEGGQYAIYSASGTLISDGTLAAGVTRVTLPAINGIYFIRTSVKEDTRTHKVMLY